MKGEKKKKERDGAADNCSATGIRTLQESTQKRPSVCNSFVSVHL